MCTLGASEVFWRLYEFNIHNRHPKVVTLTMHLKDQQQVYYDEEDDIAEVLNNLKNIFTCFLQLQFCKCEC